MSIRVLNLVWQHSKQKGSGLILLLAIADFADDNGFAYPSVDTLAKKSRMSERTTQNQITALCRSGELTVDRGAGPRGTNLYRVQVTPNLELFEGANAAGGAIPAGDAAGRSRGVQPSVKGGAAATAPEPLRTTRKNRKAGEAPPSPVAAAFKVYQDGIKKLYGFDYPPSASANGMLARVVSKVGADNAGAVVGFYIGSKDPWYLKTKHRLENLVRDCVQLYGALQRAADGAGPTMPTAMTVRLVRADDQVCRDLGDFPLGDPAALAKDVATAKYARMIAGMQANKVDIRYVDVMVGQKRHRYSLAELAA